MNTTIIKFYQSNPELMGKLMIGLREPVGDGLEIQLIHHGLYAFGLGECNVEDSLEFEFFIEGRSIGSVDQDAGGYIEGCEEDDWKLFTAVTARMIELFPGVIETE